jgi:hypothetical protein
LSWSSCSYCEADEEKPKEAKGSKESSTKHMQCTRASRFPAKTPPPVQAPKGTYQSTTGERHPKFLPRCSCRYCVGQT